MTILHIFSKYFTRIICVFVFLVIIVSRVSGYNKNYNNIIKNTENITKVDKAIAKITSFPVYEEARIVFEAKITDKKSKLTGTTHKVYYKTKDNPKIQPGDTVIISGNRVSPSPLTNPGGFDTETYFKSENIHGNIFADEVELKKESTNGFVTSLYGVRQKFLKKADKYFDSQYTGIVKALVTGDRNSISDADSEALKKSGVYHIVAISGLHLNIFIMIFSKLIAGLKLKRLKKSILAFAVCTAVGFFVIIFTGFGLSVIRAFSMLVISLGSSVFVRKYSGKNSLLLSAVFIMIFIPSSFFNVGFRLSVLSTYGVLISGSIVNKLKEKGIVKGKVLTYTAGTFVTSITCMIVTLPVTANSFGYVSVYSPLANLFILLLIAPALGGCVSFGITAILGFDSICKLISYVVSMLVFGILNVARLVASLPFSTLNTYPEYAFPAFLCVILVAVIIYLIFKNKKLSALVTAIFLFVANIGYFMYNNSSTDAKIVFADVDQGDCSIVVLPGGYSIMFDFGSNSDIDYMADDIKSTLVKLNIKKLSAVFVSHFHKDHVTGITELAEDGLTEKVFVPKVYDTTDEESIFNRRQLLAVCQKTKTPMVKVSKGDRITVGDATIDIYAPNLYMNLDANDMSTVAKMSYGNTEFLFTGDVSKKGIKELEGADISCDVLKVPHHGSRNSAIETFIRNIDPEYAVISCSENNVYKHPHKETVELLNENDIKIYRTDKMGAIIFNINKEKIKSVETMR